MNCAVLAPTIGPATCCCGLAGLAPTNPATSLCRCGSGLYAAKVACWALLGAAAAWICAGWGAAMVDGPPAALEEVGEVLEAEGMLDLSLRCRAADESNANASAPCLGEWWKMAFLRRPRAVGDDVGSNDA